MKLTQEKILKLIGKVARNEVEEAISGILDAVSDNLEDKPDDQMAMFAMTLEVLKDKNQGLWFKISLRLGKLYLDAKEFDKLNDLLITLKNNCKKISDN